MLLFLTKIRQAAAANGIAQWLPAGMTKAGVRRLAKEGFWVLAGQVLAVTGAIVGVRVLTELLPPEAYGELALGMTAATLLNQVVFGPLGNGAGRFYAVAKEVQDIRAYLVAVKGLVLSATELILLAAIVIGGILALSGQGRWVGLGAAAIFFALVSGYNGILDGIQNAARQRSVVALHQGLGSWVRFVGAAGVVLLTGRTSTAAMAGYATGLLLVLLSQVRILARTTMFSGASLGATVAMGERWRTCMVEYAWPFATWGWLTWAQQASDRWALGFCATTDQVGQYTVLYQLGYYPLMFASGLLVQVASPVLFEKAGAGRNMERISSSSYFTRLLAACTVVGALAVFFLFLIGHRQIFALLVGQQYRAFSGLLPWMALAGGLFAVGQVLCLEFMTSVSTRFRLVTKVSTAIIGIALNLIGARLYGVAGVVAANVLWSVIYIVFIAAYLKFKESAVRQEMSP